MTSVRHGSCNRLPLDAASPQPQPSAGRDDRSHGAKRAHETTAPHGARRMALHAHVHGLDKAPRASRSSSQKVSATSSPGSFRLGRKAAYHVPSLTRVTTEIQGRCRRVLAVDSVLFCKGRDRTRERERDRDLHRPWGQRCISRLLRRTPPLSSAFGQSGTAARPQSSRPPRCCPPPSFRWHAQSLYSRHRR